MRHAMPRFAMFFLLAACGALLGCNSSDHEKLSDLHGIATYKGEPIPVGRIDFVSKEGEAKAQGYAIIEQGKYDTGTNGRAVIQGNVVARVTGFDGKARPELELAYGKPLFKVYEKSIEVSPGAQTLDFDVQ